MLDEKQISAYALELQKHRLKMQAIEMLSSFTRNESESIAHDILLKVIDNRLSINQTQEIFEIVICLLKNRATQPPHEYPTYQSLPENKESGSSSTTYLTGEGEVTIYTNI